MCAIGYAVGWRPTTSVAAVAASMFLMLLFGYAVSWIFATVGLMVSSPEAAQAAAFPVVALLVFVSSGIVPVATMPDGLRAFAEHQPLSAAVAAVRDLTLGGPTSTHVLIALAWCIGIVAVAAPLAVRIYRRAA